MNTSNNHIVTFTGKIEIRLFETIGSMSIKNGNTNFIYLVT